VLELYKDKMNRNLVIYLESCNIIVPCLNKAPNQEFVASGRKLRK